MPAVFDFQAAINLDMVRTRSHHKASGLSPSPFAVVYASRTESGDGAVGLRVSRGYAD